MAFLEMASIASAECSMNFFNKHFAQLIFMFRKEKNKEVAIKFCKHVLKYRLSLSKYQHDSFGFTSPHASPSHQTVDDRLQEILTGYQTKFAPPEGSFMSKLLQE
mmetsp:Transcript_10948/g.8125  ORF Transcript_10948/g.8125 Transcript_10948/m.8125 type:complete len:105 (-) Transcript_10948:525-839(-)